MDMILHTGGFFMDIIRRIECLRREMACEGIDIYIVPSADCHGSEYVGDYFKIRQYLTGFTGSAGTAVFTRDKAGLWTDGRYYIQAEEQLKGSVIHLYRMGEPDTDTIKVDVTIKKVQHNKEYFCLVLASKVTKDNANAFVDELKQKGYDEANVLTENNKSIKVTYGHYATQQEAFNALNELQGNENFYDAWVYQVKN